MNKLLLSVVAVSILSGCTKIVVQGSFPNPPEKLMEKSIPLKPIKKVE